MSYVGAYYRKYKYPNTRGDSRANNDIHQPRSHLYNIDELKPQYKVDGMEPDVADANLLDNDIADIGRKLGSFQADINAAQMGIFNQGIDGGLDDDDAVAQRLHNDELISSRINVIGSDDTASTVEPEVRRIFGEYQTAAFLDSLSDSDSDSDDDIDTTPDTEFMGAGDDNVDNDNVDNDNVDNDNVDNDDIISGEKSFHGINYYEVDNTKQYIDAPAISAPNDTTVIPVEEVVGAGLDWNELLE
ncbi:hypothetical protein F-LCD7_0461 [Faustovirus]|nr:hypothetical protein F-LCD7_0461 [Faustovirus]